MKIIRSAHRKKSNAVWVQILSEDGAKLKEIHLQGKVFSLNRDHLPKANLRICVENGSVRCMTKLLNR